MSHRPRANGSRLGRKMRLTHARQYDAVYQAKVRTAVGPLVIWGLPNELGHPRLGLAVSRRVGTAVARNRIKRLVREAFRLMQHDVDTGYDLVISVRPHEVLTLAEYQRILFKAARKLHLKWSRKLHKPDNGR